MAATDQPAIDFSNWVRPTDGDARFACPALNALANHGILPQNGKNISKQVAVQALTEALHLDVEVATAPVLGGMASNSDHHAHAFDLDHINRHNFIEHDCSISRKDAAFGSNTAFSQEKFGIYLEDLRVRSTDGQTSWKAAADSRYRVVIDSKLKHDESGQTWTYGLKEAILSYGESALYLNVLGRDGITPTDWVKIFFEEERLPYAEGWRPPTRVTQSMLNHACFEMIASNERSAEEARVIGLGTVDALKKAVLSLISLPSAAMCAIV